MKQLWPCVILVFLFSEIQGQTSTNDLKTKGQTIPSEAGAVVNPTYIPVWNEIPPFKPSGDWGNILYPNAEIEEENQNANAELSGPQVQQEELIKGFDYDDATLFDILYDTGLEEGKRPETLKSDYELQDGEMIKDPNYQFDSWKTFDFPMEEETEQSEDSEQSENFEHIEDLERGENDEEKNKDWEHDGDSEAKMSDSEIQEEQIMKEPDYEYDVWQWYNSFNNKGLEQGEDSETNVSSEEDNDSFLLLSFLPVNGAELGDSESQGEELMTDYLDGDIKTLHADSIGKFSADKDLPISNQDDYTEIDNRKSPSINPDKSYLEIILQNFYNKKDTEGSVNSKENNPGSNVQILAIMKESIFYITGGKEKVDLDSIPHKTYNFGGERRNGYRSIIFLMGPLLMGIGLVFYCLACLAKRKKKENRKGILKQSPAKYEPMVNEV